MPCAKGANRVSTAPGQLASGRPAPAKRIWGAGCQEISIPVQPVFNGVPLRQGQRQITVQRDLSKVAGLAPAAEQVPRAPAPAIEAAEAAPRTPLHRSGLGWPASEVPEGTAGRGDLAWGSDGEEVYILCPECRLPLGELSYDKGDRKGLLLHGECKAQLLVRDAQKEEAARVQEDAAVKKERRVKYDLGWKVQRVPRNLGPARALSCCPLPRGMCGLQWQEETKSVIIVPTTDQAATLNLEYLSLALRVRREEGREPMFSLDPKVDALAADKHELWQVKRFVPEWLEGTSIGEVMFQADYHLKELSMGEYAQPVVGMKSCFDISEEEGANKDWCAREWFVVNKAEIQLGEGNIVIPRVKMGVEARETFKGPNGLEDVPITRPDHPLVKYADAFTHNFDLIAERKSVVYHLRELAKASVLAKFLVENEARLEEPWFSLAGSTRPPSCKEIPQLWNEQRVSRIQVADGKIVTSAGKINMHTHGVYGGVEMGLERLGRVPVGRVPVAKVSSTRAPALSQRLVAARPGIAEMPLPGPAADMRVPPTRAAAALAAVPARLAARGVEVKGVDLNLDQFELTATTDVAHEAPEGSWTGEGFVGNAFWRAIAGPGIKEDDQSLMMNLFNPNLCDRRDDGELFVPPDTSLAHVESLRALVEEEAATRKERMERFFSPDFDEGVARSLFPSSWAPGISARRSQNRSIHLHPRPDYKVQASKLSKNATPVFDEATEDGTRFRIYRLGALEVRTTEEHDGEEAVGAVFSTRPAAPMVAEAAGLHAPEGSWSTVASVDEVVKVVEHVEAVATEGGARSYRFYTVLETDQGDMIVTEQLRDGTVTWIENPVDFEYRSSMSKAVRAVDCRGSCITVRDLRSYQREAASREGCASRSNCKQYAHGVFLHALPAKDKCWAVLSEHERQVAQRLGVEGSGDWERRSRGAWSLAWRDLQERQREAARSLGFSKATWDEGKAESSVEKQVAQLSEAEQEAMMEKWFLANCQALGGHLGVAA